MQKRSPSPVHRTRLLDYAIGGILEHFEDDYGSEEDSEDLEENQKREYSRHSEREQDNSSSKADPNRNASPGYLLANKR